MTRPDREDPAVIHRNRLPVHAQRDAAIATQRTLTRERSP